MASAAPSALLAAELLEIVSPIALERNVEISRSVPSIIGAGAVGVAIAGILIEGQSVNALWIFVLGSSSPASSDSRSFVRDALHASYCRLHFSVTKETRGRNRGEGVPIYEGRIDDTSGRCEERDTAYVVDRRPFDEFP